MKKGGRGVQFLLTRNPKRIPALRSIATKALSQYDIGPTSFSTSAISTITMASQGQPSRKQPSGPLLRHFLQPMHWRGSIWMRPNGGLSSSGTQNIQSSTGQYSTQAGDPAQPVQHSVITASSFGFFLRAVTIPFERGSNFCSSGTIPGAFTTSGALAISSDFTLSVKSLSAWFLPPLQQSRACYNARAIRFGSPHVPQNSPQTSLPRAPRRTCAAPLFHLAFPLLLRRYRLLRRACPQLALPRYLWFLLPRTASPLGCTSPRLSGLPRHNLFSGRHRQKSGHACTSFPRSCDVRFRRRYLLSPGGRRLGSCSWPDRSRPPVAHGSLPIHRQLRCCPAHGGVGNIFHHARAAGFSVAGGNGVQPSFLQQRFAPRHKNLVRGRTRRW